MRAYDDDARRKRFGSWHHAFRHAMLAIIMGGIAIADY